MVVGGAAGVMLGIPAVSQASDGTVTAGAQPAADTAATAAAATATRAQKPGGPLADAVDSALKGLVDNKTITQAQSDAVKAAIKDKVAALPRKAPGGLGRLGGHPGLGAIKGDILGTASKALGMTPDELATELRSGKTISEIAKSKNVEPQKVVDALVGEANTKIDQAVKNGKLTTEQGDNLKSKVKDRVTDAVNNPHPLAHGHGHGKGFGPHPDGETTTTTTPPAGTQ
jgi:hypothetical protein